jgi:hypothetical protein
MKAILYKRDDNFYSLKVDGIVMATSNGMLVDYNLSKQNCDDIFGIIDVEKLADEYLEKHFSTGLDTNYIQNIVSDGIKYGFNKAMELNRFTLGDIKRAISFGQGMDLWKEEEQIDKFIQSLQQPTEIDVVIVMETIYGIFDYKELRKQPKLDSSGNLILKKI